MRIQLNWKQANSLLTATKRFENNLTLKDVHTPEEAWELAMEKTFKKKISFPKGTIYIQEIGRLRGRVQSVKNEMRSLRSEKVKDPVISVSLGAFNQLLM